MAVDPQWAVLGDTERRRVWDEVLRPVARLLRASAAPLSDEIVGMIRSEGSDLFSDVPDTEEAMTSTEENLRLLAQIILVGSDPWHIELPPSFAALIRGSVWRHVPLSFHTQNYRRAQRGVW